MVVSNSVIWGFLFLRRSELDHQRVSALLRVIKLALLSISPQEGAVYFCFHGYDSFMTRNSKDDRGIQDRNLNWGGMCRRQRSWLKNDTKEERDVLYVYVTS